MKLACLSFYLMPLPLTADSLSKKTTDSEGNFIVPGVRGDIVYHQVGDLQLSLDAYIQKTGDKRPAVIVVHGGGWTSGSRVSRVGQLLEVLTRGGFNWFSIDYRLAPTHKYPLALNDLRVAVEFIRRRADEFCIDKDRIALVGEDSGAHLAAMLASEKPPGVQALVALGGIYDLRPLDRFKGEGFATLFGNDGLSAREAVLKGASPIVKVSGSMPPVLVVHGLLDSEVPVEQATRYCTALEQAGGQCEAILVEDAIHAVENWRPEQWAYKARIVDFLSQRLGLDEPDFVPHPSRLQKNIVYGTYEGASGHQTDLLLDFWTPKGDGLFPAVILAHGGGWEAGDKVTYLTPMLEPLSRAGFAWFSIDYRLTPTHRHPDQLADLRRAIRYVRHHAREFRIDPNRIAILGESASGQMVLQVAVKSCAGHAKSCDAVDREPCTVQAVVSFYGVYDFLPMITDASPRSLLTRLFDRSTLDAQSRELLKRYSPLYHVHRNMPPVLLINGTNEPLWKQAVVLKQRLSNVGAEHTLYAIPGAPHGMENWEGHPEWVGYKRVVVDWLRLRLGRKNSESQIVPQIR